MAGVTGLLVVPKYLQPLTAECLPDMPGSLLQQTIWKGATRNCMKQANLN